MATVEEFLIGIKLDPKSVQRFLKQVEAVKQRAELGIVNISVTSNAAAVLGTTSAATATLGVTAAKTTTAFTAGLQGVAVAAAQLRTSLIAVTAIAGVGFGLAIGAAASESINLARANVILGQSAGELQKTRTELRKISIEASRSFQDTSAALFGIASSGRRGADALNATAAAARVAGPAGASLAQTYAALDAIMKNFADVTADEAADKLVVIADAAVATVDEVATAISRFGPQAAALGIPLEEVGAAFAVLTGRQIDATIATTQIRAAMNALVAPSQEAQKELKKAGVTFGATSFRAEGLVDKIAQLAEKSDEINLAKIFPQEAITGALVLTGSIDEFRKQIEKIEGSAGRARKAFASFQDEVGVQLKGLITSITNFATVFGRDLLDALKPLIIFVKDFINENQGLLSILVKVVLGLGALISTIVIATFVTKTYRAIVDLLANAKKFLLGFLVKETVATTANTSAQALNSAARGGVLATVPLLQQNIFALGRLLIAETVSLIKNGAAWVANSAKRVFGSIVSFIVRIGVSLGLISQETLAVNANTAAFRANALARTQATAANSGFIATLFTSIKVVSAGALAVGALAAAFIGWKVGRAIDDLLGISKAAGESARNLELAKIQTRENNIEGSLAEKALKKNGAAMQRFNLLLKANIGLTKARAAALALDENQRIAQLSSLQRDGKLTVEGESLLADALANRSTAQEDATLTARKLNDATLSAAGASARFKIIEEDLAKAIEETTKRTIKARLGQVAIDIRTAQEAFEVRTSLFAKASANQLAQIDLTNAKLASAEAKGISTSGLEKRLAEQIKVFNVSQDLIIAERKNFNVELEALQQRQIDSATQTAKKLIDTAQRTANRLIGIEQKRVDDAKRIIEELQSARDSAIKGAQQFFDRLRQAAIQRVDPALAELRKFEREARKALTDAAPEDAQRGIEDITAVLNRLGKETRAETEALKEFKEAQQAVREADTGDEAFEAVNRELRARTDLTNQEKLREARAIIINRLQAEFNNLVATSDARESNRASEVEAQQNKILAAQVKIAQVRQAVEIRESAINAKLTQQLALFERIIAANKRLADASKQAKTLGILRATDTEDKKFNEESKRIIAELDAEVKLAKAETARLQRAEAVFKSEVQLQELTANSNTALKTLDREITKIDENVKRLDLIATTSLALTSELARVAGSARDAQAELITSVDDVLKEQSKFSASVELGFETVSDKMEELAKINKASASRLSTLTRMIQSLGIRDPEKERRSTGR